MPSLPCVIFRWRAFQKIPPVANGQPEKKAASARAFASQRPSRHATRHFSAIRVRLKRFHRFPVQRCKFLGKRFFQSHHRRRRKPFGTEVRRPLLGQGRDCGRVAKRSYAWPPLAGNPETSFSLRLCGILLLEILIPKAIVALCTRPD